MSQPKNDLNNSRPLKTIVGGRPDNREKMIPGLPSGIQRLIVSASLSDVIKASVIRNPAQAAKDLKIELSDSESAILSSVPVKQLIIMIEGMENNPGLPRREFLFESAAVIAAVAASALGLEATASQYPATQGISATRGISFDVPAIVWGDSLNRALGEAKKNRKPLLVVFRHSLGFKEKHPPTEAEAYSEMICEIYSPDLRKEIYKNRLIPLRLEDEEIAADYRLTVFPTVLFLSPDGAALGQVIQPREENEITESLLKAMAVFQKRNK